MECDLLPDMLCHVMLLMESGTLRGLGDSTREPRVATREATREPRVIRDMAPQPLPEPS
jgi:hypothetical protein